MKITGATPKIAIPTFLYMIITIIIDSLTYPQFKLTMNNYSLLVTIAVIMIVIGAIMVITVARKLLKSFKAGVLMTDGLYKVFRNPMYAAYLIFIIPGISLLFNSWLVLTTVIINWTLTFIFIKEEYRYLEEKFGDDYKAYLEKVWIKFI
jgi:protein-S-isoprenylcysteine O-methyltransferase Ste14